MRFSSSCSSVACQLGKDRKKKWYRKNSLAYFVGFIVLAVSNEDNVSAREEAPFVRAHTYFTIPKIPAVSSRTLSHQFFGSVSFARGLPSYRPRIQVLYHPNHHPTRGTHSLAATAAS